MYNLEFTARNCDGIEVLYQYHNPTDYLSLVDYGNDEESMVLPMLDDEVTEMKYYGNYVSLKQNHIETVSDIYDYCAERE